MNKFINNFKKFIEHYKVKQSILVIKTGYDKNKLSRLLTGKTNLNANDMDILASAVGKKAIFFMNEVKFNDINLENSSQIAFSAGEPTPQKTEYANKLFDLLENIDLILGMENKINCNLNEV